MNRSQRRSLARLALRKSIEVRAAAGHDLQSPICIWKLCEDLGLSVRFVELGFEGMYVRGTPPNVFVCAMRPLPRRVYTAAHEVGHHVFGHGSQVDELTGHGADTDSLSDPDEYLVEVFAGFLLMPPTAVQYAFRARGISPLTASPKDVYVVASSLGVGYGTLVDHMSLSLGILDPDRRKALRRHTPQSIRRSLLGVEQRGHLVVIDAQWPMPTVDLEVGDHILVCQGERVVVEGACTDGVETSSGVTLVRAASPGIGRIGSADGAWSVFVRSSRPNYVGLLQYRHLEDPEFSCWRGDDGDD